MTVGDLVTRALQLAGVVGMNRAPSAAEMNDGVTTLNEMLQAWTLDGMDMGLDTLSQTDEDLLDSAYVKGIRYNLACELAAAHGLLNELPQTIIFEAGNQQELIRAALSDIDNMRCDSSLLNPRPWINWITGR